MLEFRKRAGALVKQLQKGRSFILTYRGRPVAKLEPIREGPIDAADPIYRLSELATNAGSMTNTEIDGVLYKL